MKLNTGPSRNVTSKFANAKSADLASKEKVLKGKMKKSRLAEIFSNLKSKR